MGPINYYDDDNVDDYMDSNDDDDMFSKNIFCMIIIIDAPLELLISIVSQMGGRIRREQADWKLLGEKIQKCDYWKFNCNIKIIIHLVFNT